MNEELFDRLVEVRERINHGILFLTFQLTTAASEWHYIFATNEKVMQRQKVSRLGQEVIRELATPGDEFTVMLHDERRGRVGHRTYRLGAVVKK